MPVSKFRWSHPLNVLRFVVGDRSMLVSDGEDHRRRRGAVLPALARRQLDRWVPPIVGQVDAAIDGLDAEAGHEPVDLAPHDRRVTMAVVVQALFGGRMLARVDELSELFTRPQAYLESPAIRQTPHPFPCTGRSGVRGGPRPNHAGIPGLSTRMFAAKRRLPCLRPNCSTASLWVASRPLGIAALQRWVVNHSCAAPAASS